MTAENQETFADRVWRAYWSLPRTKQGRPDSFHALEREFGLANGIIGKIVKGYRNSVTGPTLAGIARALGVSMEYLADGSGAAPTPTGPVPSRTEENSRGVEDSSGHATLAPAITLEVQRAVDVAVDRAKHEAPAEAQPHQVLALALMHVSTGPATK
jgi:transcriptional regulator with XRE-family HTH domain